MVATAPGAAGRRDLDGAYARDPTFHRVLDVNAAAVGRVVALIEDQEAPSRSQVRGVAQGDDRGALPVAGGPVRGVLHAPRPAEATLEADDGVGRGSAVTLRGAREHELRPVRPG